MFTELVGQDRAIETLRRGDRAAVARVPARRPAWLGRRGRGTYEFAALLIGVGDDERGLRLVQRGVHPDVVEFAPGGASYRVKEDVRDTILPEAARAPIEADRHGADPVRGRAATRQPERVGQRDAQDDRGAAAAHGRGARHARSPTTSFPRSGRDASASTSIPSATTRCAPRSSATGSRPTSPPPRPRSRAASSRARAIAGSLAPLRAVFAYAPAPRRRHRGHRARDRRGARAGRSTAPPTRSPASRRGARASSTPSSSGSATATATRARCGAGSRSATSARCAAPHRPAPRGRDRDRVGVPRRARRSRAAAQPRTGRGRWSPLELRPRRSTPAAPRARRS